jgi:hypothetical protein
MQSGLFPICEKTALFPKRLPMPNSSDTRQEFAEVTIRKATSSCLRGPIWLPEEIFCSIENKPRTGQVSLAGRTIQSAHCARHASGI